MAIIHTLVEGLMDEAAANSLIKMAGHTPGTCFGKKGYAYIQAKVRGFNQTAVGAIYLALVDFMDTKLACPSEVVSQWVPHRQPNLLFRIVVRELESWLLADKENLADFLNVSVAKPPTDPERLNDPKLTLSWTLSITPHNKRRQLSAQITSAEFLLHQIGDSTSKNGDCSTNNA